MAASATVGAAASATVGEAVGGAAGVVVWAAAGAGVVPGSDLASGLPQVHSSVPRSQLLTTTMATGIHTATVMGTLRLMPMGTVIARLTGVTGDIITTTSTDTSVVVLATLATASLGLDMAGTGPTTLVDRSGMPTEADLSGRDTDTHASDK